MLGKAFTLNGQIERITVALLTRWEDTQVLKWVVLSMHMISADDRELVQQLIEDVNILSGMIGPDRNPTPQAARAIVAPILRRWICEQLFYKSRLVLPHKVQFAIFEFPVAVDNCRKGTYEHWIGLLSYNGVGISSMLPRKDLILPDGRTTIPIPRDDGGRAPVARIGKKFFDQPMFYWQRRLYTPGCKFSRSRQQARRRAPRLPSG